MALNNQNRYDWEDVYTQAAALRKRSPWNILPGEVIFKINSPYLDQPAYCLFIGSNGEVLGINIYIGEAGYQTVSAQNTAGNLRLPEYHGILHFLNQHLIQVEYVNPHELEKSDRAKHKAFGISMSGNFQGIKVRHFNPGLVPCELVDHYLPFVADCLEQASIVVDLAKKDDSIEENFIFDRQLLVRTGTETEDDVEWVTTKEEAPDNMPHDLNLAPAASQTVADAVKQLKKFPIRDKPMLFHVQYTAGRIQNKRDRPYFALIGCLLEANTGFAYQPVIMNRSKLPRQFGKFLVQQIKELGYYPSQIMGTSAFACQLIEPYCEALDLELRFEPADENIIELSMGLRNMMP